jgi:hypothetical protein
VTLAAWAIAAVCGCGNGDDGGSGSDAGVTSQRQSVDFPRPTGRSFRGLLEHYPQGPAVAPSVSVLRPGENRFGFALFDSGNRQIADLDVALYVAEGVDEAAHGPFPARYTPIQVDPDFRSRTSADDPDSARSVYVAKVDFPHAGSYLVSAVAKLTGRFVAAQPAQVRIRRDSGIPDVGDRAIRVHTPTAKSVGGDIAKIETRVPPDSMHEVDLADALDRHRPVILLFSTPALCQSRVCGPVTDVAEQVKSEFDGKVDFIHMEFYVDNEIDKGPRPQVRAWGLQAEPFLFAIDSKGIVVDRIQGAFGADELRAAVHKALR